MAWVPKILASGQLASSKGTIYAPLYAAVVRAIHLTNAAAAPMTVYLYLKANGGTSKLLINGAVLAVGETIVNDTPESVGVADIIEGYASSATSVDYVITGAERQ